MATHSPRGSDLATGAVDHHCKVFNRRKKSLDWVEGGWGGRLREPGVE